MEGVAALFGGDFLAGAAEGVVGVAEVVALVAVAG